MYEKEGAKVDDYGQYEVDCEKIRVENETLLNQFVESLEKSNLSQKTIRNHLTNIDFYINEFLLYEDAIEAKDGVNEVSMFLGYWFIKKAMWANQSSIKGCATSLKKFYAFMHEKGLIEKDNLAELKETIKEEMPEWLDTVRKYDDPSIPIEEVWGLW